MTDDQMDNQLRICPFAIRQNIQDPFVSRAALTHVKHDGMASIHTTEPLGDRLLNLAAHRLRVIAEPSRIGILMLLEQREASVQELADARQLPHRNASQHLNILYSAGIVSRRREGSRMVYALADYIACILIRQVIASLAGHVEELVDAVGLDDRM